MARPNRNSPRSIALTGASGGLGTALALEYAAPGVALFLIGRNRARLDHLASAVAKRGGSATIAQCDVTDPVALGQALTARDKTHPIDLLIANAGITVGCGPDGIEAPADARRAIDTNLCGMLSTIEPLIPAMAARGAGQIALVGSLAALNPHPDLPVYSATKAAIRAYGRAIAPVLGSRGIHVAVISPGFVDTPMAARHHGAKPFQLRPDRAARIIRRGLARNRRMITFPLALTLLIRLGNLLPAWAQDRMQALFRADIGPEKSDADP